MTEAPPVPASGNPLIDHQHGRLTELIRLAANCARGHGDGTGFAAAVRAFHAALADHFVIEGILFRGAGFPQAQRHEDSHRAILERIEAVLRVLDGLKTAPGRHEVVEELERVLFDHELIEDSGYWEVIRHHDDRPAIDWTSDLVIGVDWADEQHRHLVAILNELGVAAAERRQSRVAELMERFLRHAHQHFAAEERHLETRGGPHAQHRAEHLRLLEEIEALALAVGDDPEILVNHTLRLWMLDHIRGCDKADFGPGAQPIPAT